MYIFPASSRPVHHTASLEFRGKTTSPQFRPKEAFEILADDLHKARVEAYEQYKKEQETDPKKAVQNYNATIIAMIKPISPSVLTQAITYNQLRMH